MVSTKIPPFINQGFRNQCKTPEFQIYNQLLIIDVAIFRFLLDIGIIIIVNAICAHLVSISC